MVLKMIEFKVLHVLVGELIIFAIAVRLRGQGLHGARLGAVDERVFHHGAVRGARRDRKSVV